MIRKALLCPTEAHRVIRVQREDGLGRQIFGPIRSFLIFILIVFERGTFSFARNISPDFLCNIKLSCQSVRPFGVHSVENELREILK